MANGNIQSTELTLAGGSTPETTLSHLESPQPADPELAAIPVGPARNVAALYAAFAEDLAKDTCTVPDFAHALTIQTLIADIQASVAR